MLPFDVIEKQLQDVASSPFWTEGKYVKLFEKEVEKMHEKEAVAMNSCGASLFAVMSALPKKTGRVVVPVNTFYATGGMAREAGWEVVLADASDDFSLSPETIIEAVGSSQVDGVILTHVGGPLATTYREIAALCDQRGWFLVEDAAHAFGTVDATNGLRAGDLGLAAVFSFYPTKSVPAGEGGAVVTSDAALAEHCRIFRNYGKHVVNGVLQYSRGFNLRMDEWTAAVAYTQVLRLGDIIQKRQSDASKIEEMGYPVHPAFKGRSTNWYKYVVKSNAYYGKEAGKIYARSDQLDVAMGFGGSFDLSNAAKIALDHKCVPMGEGLYSDMTLEELQKLLGA